MRNAWGGVERDNTSGTVHTPPPSYPDDVSVLPAVCKLCCWHEDAKLSESERRLPFCHLGRTGSWTSDYSHRRLPAKIFFRCGTADTHAHSPGINPQFPRLHFLPVIIPFVVKPRNVNHISNFVHPFVTKQNVVIMKWGTGHLTHPCHEHKGERLGSNGPPEGYVNLVLIAQKCLSKAKYKRW